MSIRLGYTAEPPPSLDHPSLPSFFPPPSSFSPFVPRISPSSFAVTCVEAFLSSLFILLMINLRSFSNRCLLLCHVDEFPWTLPFYCVRNLIISHSVLFEGWVFCSLSTFFFKPWEWTKKKRGQMRLKMWEISTRKPMLCFVF